MSDRASKTNQPFRFRLPLAESQVALGLGAALFVLCSVQFANFTLTHLLLIVVFFAVGILWQRAWAIYLMLGVIVILMYYLGITFFKSEITRLRLSNFQGALVLILLAAACFRHLETGRFLKAFYPDSKMGEQTKSNQGHQFPSLLGGRWWAIPMAIFAASVLLSIFPFEKQMLATLEIMPRASRVIFLTLFLFFGWYVCRALIETVIRWRMDISQADVHCRSLIAKELWKETYPIEKRRSKTSSRE